MVAIVVVFLAGVPLLAGRVQSFATALTLGNTTVGNLPDTYEANDMTGSQFTTGASGGVTTTASVYVGNVDAAPNNQFQVAIYSNDSNNAPDALIASSGSGTLVANSWNQVAITATLAPNTTYWIVYNTNAVVPTHNNLRYSIGGWGAYSAPTTYGTWPASFSAYSAGSWNFSIYLTYTENSATPTPTVAPTATPTVTPTVTPTPTPTVTPLPSGGPGGPVLIITSSGDAFSQYYGEILTAEGLNYYKMVDESALTPELLANYDVAILGSEPVTDADVAMLTRFVDAGGQLIAIRPDAKLAALLGLTATGQTLSEGYLQIGSSNPATVGITHAVIQYHGTADRYTLNGATAIANLYTDISTPAGAPAVTINSVGTAGGHAAAFTYDLARSIVMTRQGNPAWVGQNRDGVDSIETPDLFYGNASYDPQPNWNNLSQNGLIPIADEQQRLLANMITTLDVLKPLPRFWYLPFDKPAAVVLTGDDHGQQGTAGRFAEELSQSPPNCVVADWTCVRSTSYVWLNAISPTLAQYYTSLGFEVGSHLDVTGDTAAQCYPWSSPATFQADVANELAAWHAFYPTLSGPVTNRTHCVEWDDWSTEFKVESLNGIRLDLNYYYYPSNFTQGQPAYFNGTGEVMPFADLNGTLSDVYQATTLLTDESGLDIPSAINTLLDLATGPQQYYATIVANMHTDHAISAGHDAIVAAAQARGIPLISAKQLLTWLDGRNNSSISGMNWVGNDFQFNVNAAPGSHGMYLILPMSTLPNETITSITSGANNVPFTTQTIKGIQYAVFPVQQGAYDVAYSGQAPAAPSVVPPVLGYNVVGASPDVNDANYMNGSLFQMAATQAVTKITTYIGPVSDAPNNQYQVAIYSDDNGTPGTLLVQSASGTLTPDAWNTIAIPSTNLTGGTNYWLMFNTNSPVTNMWWDFGANHQSAWNRSGQPFGTWPSAFPTTAFGVARFSIYAGN